MPSFQNSELTMPTITADRILALDTAHVVEYMKRNPGTDGGYELDSVDGWGDLSDIGRAELAKKLRIAVAIVESSDTTRSAPFDADVLGKLLEKVKGSPRAVQSLGSLGDRSPTPQPHPSAAKGLEVAAYHELLKDGGRPLFSLHLLNQVAENQGRYYDMLQPWVIDLDSKNPNDWCVFSRQWDKWREFRQWQLHNREDLNNSVDGYSTFREAIRKKMILTGGEKVTTQPGFEETVGRMWEQETDRLRWQREIVKEECPGGDFAGYLEAATRRLVRHGFTQPFQFKEDPKQQDMRTTWIEYIDFVCWSLDVCISSTKRLQPQYDKSLKHLVDSGVLMDYDMLESLSTIEARNKREKQEKQAENTVQTARKAADILRGRGTPVCASAQSDLRRADESLQAIKKRNHLIQELIKNNQEYQETKRNTRRQTILLQSLLEIYHQIEAEEKQHDVTKDYSDATRSSRKRHSPLDSPSEPMPRKRRKRGDDDGTTDLRTTRIKMDQDDQTRRAIGDVIIRKSEFQQRRITRSTSIMASMGNARMPVWRTRDEWLKSLRRRPQNEHLERSRGRKQQGH